MNELDAGEFLRTRKFAHPRKYPQRDNAILFWFRFFPNPVQFEFVDMNDK